MLKNTEESVAFSLTKFVHFKLAFQVKEEESQWKLFLMKIMFTSIHFNCRKMANHWIVWLGILISLYLYKTLFIAMQIF